MNIYRGRFKGRTAIVTGAASGIGRDVARRLSAEGAKVSIWDANEAALAPARRSSRPNSESISGSASRTGSRL
ncbi:hypothetical protein B5V03_02040 [Bradyrhizobium betae]|uniref:SDR family NAD(P)-dependent oxidoreductase n=1 Tax=Bradyrhizobium betae TaxID=244734 RepID=A0A4Q1VS06_9BRAD|nr:hypothetical protein B5V03_02040 [Bradyrhizobium betae]